MIEIDKGIPIPVKKSGTSANYPFSSMEVGDSFFIAVVEANEREKMRKRVFANAIYWGRITNRKFCVRAVEGGLRVWRIE